jgi:hypothetical protein
VYGVNNKHYKNWEKCEKMLVVGTVSSIEEQEELHFIAEIAIIGERIRVLARQQKTDKKY